MYLLGGKERNLPPAASGFVMGGLDSLGEGSEFELENELGQAEFLVADAPQFKKSSARPKPRGKRRQGSISPPPSPPALDIAVTKVGLIFCPISPCIRKSYSPFLLA